MDIAKLRAETPACRHVAHFNSAGAAPMPLPVYEIMRAYRERELEIGGYEAHAERREDIEAVYTEIAALIGARPEETALNENASRGFHYVLASLDLGEGDVILTSDNEYPTLYWSCLQLRRRGVEVRTVPGSTAGPMSLEALEHAIDARTKAIVLTHVPTHSGMVQPAAEVGAVARRRGLTFILDATQSVGVYPGIGFTYVAGDMLERLVPPHPDLGGASWNGPDDFAWKPGARRFETWENDRAATLGLAEAARYCLALGIENIWERCREVNRRLRETLAAIPGVNVVDFGPVSVPLVAVEVVGRHPREVQAYLRERSIMVHVSMDPFLMAAVRRPDLEGTVRVSGHYFNNDDDLAALAAALGELAGRR